MDSYYGFEYFSIFHSELEGFKGVLVSKFPDEFSNDFDPMTCLGGDGWELVTSLPSQNMGDYLLVFKRRSFWLVKDKSDNLKYSPGSNVYKKELKCYNLVLKDTREKKKEYIDHKFRRVKNEKE